MGGKGGTPMANECKQLYFLLPATNAPYLESLHLYIDECKCPNGYHIREKQVWIPPPPLKKQNYIASTNPRYMK